MKVSIAWVFDHIDADYHAVDIPELMDKLNNITAEIEGYRKIVCDVAHYTLVTIQSVHEQEIQAYSPELLKKITVSIRSGIQENECYLVVKEDATYRWATTLDLGGQKEMFLPAIHVDSVQQKGVWKKAFEKNDYIFQVDNKSITNRPDLWGHRGFAREIAAILDFPMKPLSDFCVAIKEMPYDVSSKANSDCPFLLNIEDSSLTHRFAGLSLPAVRHTPSLLWMVARLARVDSRSINAIVDCTNYVMLDTSQPMHAFDANRLKEDTIIARRARNKEMLMLLDDQMITLTSNDIVIANGSRPIALAGIMGGKETSVHEKTEALFLESANFNATTIRQSSLQHKIRTEASARFEKSLDPNQNVMALRRFIKLLKEADISYQAAQAIISLGKPIASPVIQVAHNFIEARLGVSIAPDFVSTTLEKLDFSVVEHSEDTLIYTITVPTFRATKDIALPEDIVEEVGRFYGYAQIPAQLPLVGTKPSPLHSIMQQYRIKQLLAFGLSMRELYTYAFFDESFLHEIDWDPGKTVQVKDPVSENWQRLVTTLMPNMLKAIAQNYNEYDQLRFFELARCWSLGAEITEQKRLTGIVYSKHSLLNFYDVKAQIHKLFIQLGMPVRWNTILKKPYPWFDINQTAHLEYNGQSVGLAGMIDQSFIKKCIEGSLFIFEFNAQLLLDYQKTVTQFVPLPKYPPINRDISMMVPMALSVHEITYIISQVDPCICSVQLIDMFQKKEWKEERSLTFRYVLRAEDKTMTKDQADKISKKVYDAVTKAGAIIR